MPMYRDVKNVSGSAVVAVVFALTGCGGGAGATASADCLAVPAEVMTRIAEGANDENGFVAREAAAVLGSEGEVHFVAMRFDAQGQSDMVGVWSTDNLDPDQPVSTTVISVDGYAKTFTHWPNAEQAFDISPAHPSAQAAEDCLG